MSRSRFLFLFLLVGCVAAEARATSAFSGDPFDRLQAIEQEIIDCQESIKVSKSNPEVLAYHDTLRQIMAEALSIPESFDYPFVRLKHMAVLMSSDGRLRIYNWNVPLEDDLHTYGCFVAWKERSKDKDFNWVELEDKSEHSAGIARRFLTPETWAGALYYEIIPVGAKRKDYYTLLGWDGADGLITRKVIEVIELRGEKIRLGAAIFDIPKENPKRFMMAYSEEVSASLKYHADEKRIVLDHLSPRAPGLEGNPAFYGPDLTYDAFLLEKGKWVFQEQVYVTMGKDKSGRPYIDPRERQ